MKPGRGEGGVVLIALDHVVLRCADLERSRAFYEALGLVLVPEQHGAGAPHYSCTLGPTVLEIYPARGKPSSGVRLGLRVPDVEGALEALRSMEADIVRTDTEGTTPSAVLRDPDGNEVVLQPTAASG
jgi:lactoylglutathione lyase